MTQLVLPLMRKAGSGVIVNVSSLGGRLTIPLFSVYHATNDLPGPDKVAQTIYRAATDGSARLRYPVFAFPVLNLRNLGGARGWCAVMKTMVRGLR